MCMQRVFVMKFFYCVWIMVGLMAGAAQAMKRDHEGLKANSEIVGHDPDLDNEFLELVYRFGSLEFDSLCSMALVRKKIRTMILGDAAEREKLLEEYCEQHHLKKNYAFMLLVTLRKDRREYAHLEVKKESVEGSKNELNMVFLWHGKIEYDSSEGVTYVAGRCCFWSDIFWYSFWDGSSCNKNKDLKDLFSMKSFEFNDAGNRYCIKKPSFNTDGVLSIVVNKVNQSPGTDEYSEYNVVYEDDDLCCKVKQ